MAGSGCARGKESIIMTDTNIYENLTQLGGKAPLPESPDKAVLERVPNPQAGVDYLVRFAAPEFTSLCPITGQPDFAHLVIDYVPGEWLVETTALFMRIARSVLRGGWWIH